MRVGLCEDYRTTEDPHALWALYLLFGRTWTFWLVVVLVVPCIDNCVALRTLVRVWCVVTGVSSDTSPYIVSVYVSSSCTLCQRRSRSIGRIIMYIIKISLLLFLTFVPLPRSSSSKGTTGDGARVRVPGVASFSLYFHFCDFSSPDQGDKRSHVTM